MKDSHIKVYGRSPGDRGEMDLYENVNNFNPCSRISMVVVVGVPDVLVTGVNAA